MVPPGGNRTDRSAQSHQADLKADHGAHVRAPGKTGPARSITHEDYRRLLALRTDLRRFLRWSEEQARAAGIAASQHQLLLAVRGHDDRRGPTIGEVADYLLLRHHSAAELAQRTEALGLIHRTIDPTDRRVVRLTLTRQGATLLRRLSRRHLQELERLADHVGPLWAGLDEHGGKRVPGSLDDGISG